MSKLTLTIEHKIAIITIDNPPQNRIGTELMTQLSEAIDCNDDSLSSQR